MAFTPDTVAQISPITKPITTLAVLDLVVKGEIELDAPVGRYLPDAATPARDTTLHQHFWAFKGNGGMQASSRDMFGL